MADKLTRPPREGRPVLSGLLALVAIGAVIGGILGGVAWGGARVVGLGDSSGGAATSSDDDSLFLPEPERTAAGGPLVTLAPSPGGSSAGSGGGDAGEQQGRKNRKRNKQQQQQITLSAGQSAVGQFQRIDLTGSYPGGGGSILQVQRFEGGSWADFNATIPVNGDSFATFVESGQSGRNRFRVVDTDTATTSNEVRVQVG